MLWGKKKKYTDEVNEESSQGLGSQPITVLIRIVRLGYTDKWSLWGRFEGVGTGHMNA